MNDCIFCKILKGELPSYKIYEDEFTYAFLDISCDMYGHTLVIPKKHSVNVLDTDADTLGHVIATAQKVAKHYVEACGFDGVNIFNANRSAAQQSVFHLHFHVIPRMSDDGADCWPFTDKHDFALAEICDKLAIK